MEGYILDGLLRRETVVDVYESFIWTERYDQFGDFQLDVRSTPAARRLFTSGKLLAHNESYRVMKLESIEDKTDSDGKSMLTIKGRSIEGPVLEGRVVRNAMTNLTIEPNWTITGTPKDVMNQVFDHIVRNAALSPGDAIPFLQPGSIMSADTLTAPIDPITAVIDPDNLYNVLNGLATTYGLGFRLLRNFDRSELYFDVYQGSDRTTKQTILAPVVFSPNLDNLQNTTELTSVDKEKNVAYVFSDQGFQIVYAPGVDSTVAGLDRKVLMVKAGNLDGTPTADQIASYLTQVGREELGKNTPYFAFDGEISQYSTYKYGLHYNLGDMVEQQNVDGMSNNMRVTEQIFVSDGDGERSYPTLTLFKVINTGSWLSWDANKVWHDYDTDTTTVWGTLP